jgi:hypothetical protein
MASFIWLRDPQEAMDNPYEYPAQEQFSKEARLILSEISKELSYYDMRFKLSDKSQVKAIWMLHNDVLSSLQDCLDSIDNKRHRIAGKLLRDIMESLDLAAYFHADKAENRKNLDKWFADKIIPHRIYREYIKTTSGEGVKKEKADHYSELSKFTHRTYKILLYSYILGRDNLLAYDGYKESDFMVLPQTISMYYCLLANQIIIFSYELFLRETVDPAKVLKIWSDSLDEEIVQRRFEPISRSVAKARLEDRIKRHDHQ